MPKLNKFLIKSLISSVGLTVLAVQYVTFLQFGPLRYHLFVATMLIPFLISWRRIEHGVLLVVFSTPIISLFYYALNVRYSSMLAAVFLSVFLVWLIRLLSTKEPRLVDNPLNKPVMIFTGVTAFSFVVTLYRLQSYLMSLASGSGESSAMALSLFRTGFISLCGCAFFFLLVNNVRGERALRRVLGALLIGGLVVGALGLVEYFGGIKLFYALPAAVKERTVAPPDADPKLIIATFPNANLLGNYTIFLLGLALGLLPVARRYRRLLPIALGLLALFCLGLSANRTGWFGLVFGAFLGLWLINRNGLLRYDLKQGIASAALILYFLYASVTSTGLLEDLEKIGVIRTEGVRSKVSVHSMIEKMAHHRLPLWEQALRDWLHHPVLGIGIGAYSYYQGGDYYYRGIVEDPLSGKGPANPHNYYLWVLCEMGLLGMVSFSWVICSALRQGIGRIRRVDQGWKFVLVGVVSGLGGYLFALMGDHTLGFLEMQFMFWTFVGVISAV